MISGITRVMMGVIVISLLPPLVSSIRAADHGEPPLLADKPASNITDLYVFQNPNDASQVVAVIDFNPFVPAGTTVVPFNEDVTYILNIDNRSEVRDGIVLEPDQIKARVQIEMKLRKHKIRVKAKKMVQTRKKKRKSGEVPVTAFFAGLRDDPFLSNNLNVNALVIQMPIANLVHGDNPLLFWAHTETDGLPGRFQDSLGNPFRINNLVGVDPDKFNQTKPSRHVDKFGFQMGLLPDVLVFDPNQPDVFPGRRLNDVRRDGLPNNVPFLNDFPFLAGPN